MTSRIIQLCNDAAVRARAFERHGVITKRPAQSRSGVRDHDGVVVFAIAAKDVRADDWGCSSLLWSPLSPDDEALLHCRLAVRSEEHTSELQSRLHLVCRLLLEKKK